MWKNSGFTMVEIIIVVAIIAILASIIIPKFSGATARNRLTACKNIMRHTALAFEMYANDNQGYYPPDAGVGGGPIQFLATHRLVTLGYIKTNPRCPSSPTGNWSYGYSSASPYTAYYIYCSPTVGGHNEMGVPDWLPRWDSSGGLRDH